MDLLLDMVKMLGNQLMFHYDELVILKQIRDELRQEHPESHALQRLKQLIENRQKFYREH